MSGLNDVHGVREQEIPYKVEPRRPGDSAEVWAITDKAALADGLAWK